MEIHNAAPDVFRDLLHFAGGAGLLGAGFGLIYSGCWTSTGLILALLLILVGWFILLKLSTRQT